MFGGKMNNFSNPIARKNGLVIQDMPDEVLVYDVNANKAHCLNSSAAVVWKACDGSNSIADIVNEFEKSGHGKVNNDFVWLAIDQLNEKGLIEGSPRLGNSGRSRRQVIKTLALSTAVALPIIASLVAPQNALGVISCACPSPGAGPNVSCATLTGCPSITNCNPAGLCAP
jgi:hypothetical protein